jgi:hypothetical protein
MALLAYALTKALRGALPHAGPLLASQGAAAQAVRGFASHADNTNCFLKEVRELGRRCEGGPGVSNVWPVGDLEVDRFDGT